MNSKQLKERIGGTVLRLGWLIGVANFIPTLFYLQYWAVFSTRIIYSIGLVLIILATFFLILLNESFRNAFNAEFSDVLPMVQKVYEVFNVALPILFVVGLGFALTSVILSIKSKNGKISFRRLISSIVLIVFLCLGFIVYYATKSKVMGGML